jgi:ribosomal protein S27AE
MSEEQSMGEQRPTCDRCGEGATGNGQLPTDGGETYRFCARCWNALHRWVRVGVHDK